MADNKLCEKSMRFAFSHVLTAMRASSLFTLHGRKAQRGAPLAYLYATVTAHRRNQVERLIKAGWQVVKGDTPPEQLRRRVQYIRNCPPFGLKYDLPSNKWRACRLTRFCPFCYAREVVANTIDAIDFAVKQNRKHRYRLVSVRATGHMTDRHDSAAICDFIRQSMPVHREGLPEADGSFVVCNPSPLHEANGYQFAFATFALVRDSRAERPLRLMAEIASDPQSQTTFNVTEPAPALPIICKAVATALPYPREMLYNDSADAVVHLLNTLHNTRVRCRAASGVLNNAQARKQSEEATSA